MSRPNGFYGDVSISKLDAGNEIGVMSFVAEAIDGDDTGSNLGTQTGLLATFRATLDAITLGATKKVEYYVTQDLNPALPTNGAARETKLLVMYRCIATGKRYTVTVPTLQPTIPVYVDNVSVKDAVRVDTPASIVNFINAFEAFAVAPDIPSDGDGTYATNPAIEVIGLRVVGRNI